MRGVDVMTAPLASDELWSLVAPLLPPYPARPKGGRPPVPDRACLTGIVFVLKTGIQWEWLPQEMGCGSGMTCWRRLRDWHQAGVWDRLQQVLLAKLNGAECLDWDRAVVDASIIRAKGGDPSLRKRPGPIRRTARVRGRSATSLPTAVFVATPEERTLAEASKGRAAERLASSGRPIATRILPAAAFYEAEAYHQAYAKKNPLRYRFYRTTCGRDARLRELRELRDGAEPDA